MNNQKTRKSRMSSVAAENRKCTNMRMSKKATRSRAPMTKSETVNNIVNITSWHGQNILSEYITTYKP